MIKVLKIGSIRLSFLDFSPKKAIISFLLGQYPFKYTETVLCLDNESIIMFQGQIKDKYHILCQFKTVALFGDSLKRINFDLFRSFDEIGRFQKQ